MSQAHFAIKLNLRPADLNMTERTIKDPCPYMELHMHQRMASYMLIAFNNNSRFLIEVPQVMV